jgi:uncharacterized membrane protein
VAAGLTGVYAETIPNFEVLTLVVFGAGVLLGVRDGMLVAAITELIYSLLNPYGAVHPLVTVAQVTGMMVSGLAGGISAQLGVPALPVRVRALLLPLIGSVITFFFDLVTNMASGVVFGQMRATLIGGIPFALWHGLTNAALFAVLGTPLVAVFARYRLRLSSVSR